MHALNQFFIWHVINLNIINILEYFAIHQPTMWRKHLMHNYMNNFIINYFHFDTMTVLIAF
jgi:hypothetical protein